MDNRIHQTRALVAQNGWAVIQVPSDGSAPNYAYTIGLLKTFGHPEVIMFGLPEQSLLHILNAVGEQVRTGVRFAEGVLAPELIENYDCAFRTVDPAALSHYAGLACDFYESDFPMLHCIWPDELGRFPWEKGTAPELRSRQPALSVRAERTTSIEPS